MQIIFDFYAFFLKKRAVYGWKSAKVRVIVQNADECVRYAKALENAIIDFRWAENRWRF